MISKNLKQFLKEEIYIEHFDGCPAFIEMTTTGFTSRIYGSKLRSYRIACCYFKDRQGDWFTFVSDQRSIGQNVVKLGYGYIDRLRKKWLVNFGHLFKRYYVMFDRDLSKLGNAELLKYAADNDDYYKNKVCMPGFIDGFMFYADKRLHKILTEFCEKKKIPDPQHIFAMLSSQLEPSFINEEEAELLKLMKAYDVKNMINGKESKIRQIIPDSRVFALPDKQRIIDRLHMKGYCKENGFPTEIGFLSSLADFSIIERYNSVLSNLALYYAEFIRNPKRNLTRWIYIIRYSCLKTLAQKHKTSIRSIFKKYKIPRLINTKSKENTIGVKVVNIIGAHTYTKIWRLKTTEEIINEALVLKRKVNLNDIYWNLEKGEPVIYNSNYKCQIKNHNFYKKINCVNINTQS